MNLVMMLCAMLSFADGSVPESKSSDVAAQIDKGREAVLQGDDVHAEKLLSEAIVTARTAGDAISEARALFLLGYLKQLQADKTSADAAKKLYEAARDHYVDSLNKYPPATSPLDNLADVYIALGDRKAAKESLSQALQVNKRRGYFSARLADLMVADGDFEEGAKLYRQAAAASDPPPGIERKVIDTYLASGSDEEELITYLWEVAEKDAGDEVLVGAVAAFKTKGLDQEESDALFGIVATTLARQNYSFVQLAQLGILQDFVALKEREPYRERAQSLLALMEGNLSQTAAFHSWPDAVKDDDLPRDLSPRRALAELAASLGRRQLFDSELERAEGYLVLSRELGRTDDIQLATDLASVYFSKRSTPELLKLTREMDAFLYSDPGRLEQLNLAEVYEFHRALGTYYSSLERGRVFPGSISAATDQLQKAVAAAETLSKELVARGEQPFEIDASVHRLLSQSKRMGFVNGALKPNP